jgi:hypothetical protein
LYDGLDNGLGWNAGFRIHRLQGFSRVGGLFGGAFVQGVEIDGNPISWVSLESGYAFPIGENASHGYILVGLDIYLSIEETLNRQGYTLTSAAGFGPKLQTGLGIALSDIVGVDVNGALDVISLKLEHMNGEEVKSGVLFSLGMRLYFCVGDF